MRISGILLLSALAIGLTSMPAHAAAPDGWHSSLEAGVEAAAKSGKPILLITGWKRTL